MAFRIVYDPANTGIIQVDNNTGTLLPFTNIVPIWDITATTLRLQYSHYDASPILATTIYSSISLSSDGGSSYAAPASFAALVTWIGTYAFRIGNSSSSGTLPALGQATMANSLPVVMASDQSLITVGGSTVQVTVTPTITAGAYTSGYSLGGIQTITSALRSINNTGTLVSVRVVDRANQKKAMDLLIFNANPANGSYTDHAAPTYNNTDMGMLVRVVSIAATDWTTFGTYGVCDIDVKKEVKCNASNTNLYAVAIIRDTPTFASTQDLEFKYGIYRD